MDMHVNTHQTDHRQYSCASIALNFCMHPLDWSTTVCLKNKMGHWAIGQWRREMGLPPYLCLCVFLSVCLGITGWRTRGRSHRGLWGSGGRASVEIMELGNRPVRRMKNTTSQYSWECINYVWLQFSFWVKRGGELARSKSLCIFLLFICTSTVVLHIL